LNPEPFNPRTLNGEPGTLNLLLTIRRLFGGLRPDKLGAWGRELGVKPENDNEADFLN
jgi:hypothetical protein